jgi:hypothetical protein
MFTIFLLNIWKDYHRKQIEYGFFLVLTDRYNCKKVCVLSEDFMLVKGKGHTARAESHCTLTIYNLSPFFLRHTQGQARSDSSKSERAMKYEQQSCEAVSNSSLS